MDILIDEARIQARIREMAAQIEARLPHRRGDPPGLRAQGRLHVHVRPRPRDGAAGHDGLHRRVELRQEHEVVRRGAAAEGPRHRPRRAPRHHRRRHRGYRADVDLPAGHPARPRAAVAEDRVPAEQAVAPDGGRHGGLHRLHDRGQFVVGYGLDYAEKYRNLAVHRRAGRTNEALRDHHGGGRADARHRRDGGARRRRARHAAREGHARRAPRDGRAGRDVRRGACLRTWRRSRTSGAWPSGATTRASR